MRPLTFAFPIDGDVLTYLDGTETDDSLTVTVQGTAPSEVEVHVNKVSRHLFQNTFMQRSIGGNHAAIIYQY